MPKHIFTLSEALDLIEVLEWRAPFAHQMLLHKSRSIGREPSFVLQRFGDPRKWDGIPAGIYKPLGHPVPCSRNKRPCTLQHVGTGRKISADSITAFCEQAGLSNVSRYHITPVLDGKRPHHKGWFLPKTLTKQLDLRDIYGNAYRVSVQEWVTKHGYSAAAALRLLSGERQRFKQLLTATAEDSAHLRPRGIKVTSVTLRKGARTVTAPSLPAAAVALGYNKTALYPVAYGLRDTLDGFRLTKVRTKRLQGLSAPTLP